MSHSHALRTFSVIDATPRIVVLFLVSFVSSCEQPAPIAPTSAVAAATKEPGSAKEVLFPWPASLPMSGDDPCKTSETRVLNGLALEDDVWQTVDCVVERLIAKREMAKLDQFMQNIRAFDGATSNWVNVEANRVPPSLRPSLQSETPSIALFATAGQRRVHSLDRELISTFGSGSIRGLCNPWSRRKGHAGHYEITGQVVTELERAKFIISKAAREILADASQDPDLFAWDRMAAHGQTLGVSGASPEEVLKAKRNWSDWIAFYVKMAEKYCADSDTSNHSRGIYFLGYAMHTMEDAMTHRGRTNPEHAYNASYEVSPDDDDNAVSTAVKFTADITSAALAGSTRSCVRPLQSEDSGPILLSTKLTTLNFKLTLTPASYLAYKSSAQQFAPHASEPSARIRWFGPRDALPANTKCMNDKDCAALQELVLNALD